MNPYLRIIVPFFLLVTFGFLSGCKDPVVYLSPVEQFEKDLTIIDDYLAKKGITPSIEPNSEIRYVIHNPGTGANPTATDKVNVTYKGQLIPSDEIFDQNTSGISFNLNNLITAWQITIPLLKEGGSMTIYAPSYYCYGPSGSGKIPANACLTFDIGLIQIQ
ncbi:MAG: FKBP-type peptidyl-prolyl cis-trans isomerase [Cyclobacteriaceae bacterium]|nr:FKBP-type peptidyl-prolyl cis-trans isomerase [Cyclobacteriaceae bacterium]